VLNVISLEKCGNAMDEDLNPKVKVKGSNSTFATYDT
jgi:hypothetical protein